MPKQTQRSNFTDSQKAAIYSRDRATCVYSLKSLWLLDYGACPLFQWDWVDHIKPSARLGKAQENNGVCASYTYNQKKKANGADNFVLLDIRDKGGTPSDNFFDFYGSVPPELEKQLFRLAAIKPCDWYFNRAVSCLFFACQSVHQKTNYKRTPEYYHRAAQTKLQKFLVEREKGKVANFVERRLVIHPEQEDVQLLLSLSEEHNEKHFPQCIRQLEVIYAKNALAMEEFWEEKDCVAKRSVYDRVTKDPAISPAVLSTLQSHLHFREHDPRTGG